MTAGRDEMVDGGGGLRPHWRRVLGAFASLAGELPERAARLDRAAAEEGIASILPGTERAPAWRLDPVPLPLPAEEFAALESGLAQRARLIEAVLADLYGPQRLLAEGHLPPALAFANPGFLRPCRDLVPEGARLHLYAADLLRAPDGRWTVLADRTDAASGLGLAAENRRLLARVLPEAFRPVQVRPLSPFFDLWQDSLQRLAPPGSANPAVALLTQGVAHPHWFEHLLLARDLGAALVEPADLTVRNGALFLKTLQGLQPIDVLLRRGAGRLIDPLELDGATRAGVVGLLDAARAGAVRIVNHPGTAAVEVPGFAALLPGLAWHVLGETLALPSVETLWLGDPAQAARRTAAHVLCRALDDAPMPAAPDIAARPWEWAARAEPPASMAPCLEGDHLMPRAVVLRLFLVHDGERWRAMPGGLARVLAAGAVLAGRLPPGGVCKDVWVLTEDGSDIVGPPQTVVAPLALRRTTGALPSRVADTLFWLGRSVERLDRAARLVRAAAARIVGGGEISAREVAELECLLRCLVDAGVVPAEAAVVTSQAGLAQTLLLSVRGGRERGAITRLFAEVARLTEAARDRLTGDMYATFTAALRQAREETEAAGRSIDALSHALATVQRHAATVAGMAAENMVRGGGWLFLDLGRRIERAQAITAEVAAALDQRPPRIENGLRLLLELCDSAITYRSRYLTVIQPAPVLDLVLADQGNPRGLAFQLAAMHTLLDDLADDSPEQRLAAIAAGLLAEAEALVADVLAAPDQAAAAAALPPRLRDIGGGLATLSDRITRRYFALLPAAQSVGRGGGDGK